MYTRLDGRCTCVYPSSAIYWNGAGRCAMFALGIGSLASLVRILSIIKWTSKSFDVFGATPSEGTDFACHFTY